MSRPSSGAPCWHRRRRRGALTQRRHRRKRFAFFVAEHKDQEILRARRSVQKSFSEYRRCVRGLQDVYGNMKAKETRRWGGNTAALALGQSVLPKHLQAWGGCNPPEEFGMQTELTSFGNVDELLAIGSGLDAWADGATQTSAHKKQLKGVTSH